ncbi:MAG: septal ring lytic transglycosylase RlpA family protein [Treponema sp.]|nr:septal ring lytic transglycosylase RlpA family protein [Treponema sp.]
MKRIYAVFFFGTVLAVFAFSQETGSLFRQEGIASWYGSEFDGRPTASGEIFNSTLFTAAHPTLPFGTMITVTNKQNNRKVTVRVNDRGPFVSARIIDVSRAAAAELDMIATGTAPVIVESLRQNPDAAEARLPETRTPAARPVPDAPSVQEAPETGAGYSGTVRLIPDITPEQNKVYRLQVGSYRIPKNAMDTFEKLRNAGLSPAYERNGDFYRVVLAGIRAEDIAQVNRKIGEAGFREALIREER